MKININFKEYEVALNKVTDYWNTDENCYEVIYNDKVIGTVYSSTITSSKISGSVFRRNIKGYKEWTCADTTRARRGFSSTRQGAIKDLIQIYNMES